MSAEMRLAAAGFDTNWITTVLSKYGPDTLKLVEDLLASGFSPAWIIEAITTLEGWFFPVGSMMLRCKSGKMGAAPLVPGLDVTNLFNGDVIFSWIWSQVVGKITGLLDPEEVALFNAVIAFVTAKARAKAAATATLPAANPGA